MEDEWFLYKRAFHYALEGDEFLCMATLRELDEADKGAGFALQECGLAAELLATWVRYVFSEEVIPDDTGTIEQVRDAD